MRRRVISMQSRYLNDVLAIEFDSFKDPWPPTAFIAQLDYAWSFFRIVGPASRFGALTHLEGYIIGWLLRGDLHLLNLAVSSGSRGQGLARILLQHIQDEFSMRGGGLMTLEVRESNTIAQCLYHSAGFELSGRRKAYYRKDNEDAMVMTRRVLPVTESLDGSGRAH